MADKKKIKWYDSFNPFAQAEAAKPVKKKVMKKAKKGKSIDFEAAVRDRPPLSAGQTRKKVKTTGTAYQGTPTDPASDKKKIKVVKPKKGK